MQDVCLFAHFDRNDRVDEYVLRYLRKIKELNFSIVFISASQLAAAEIERIRAECCDVIVRENAGLDFGSWVAGFARHGASINGRLLLANDSVYGPFGSLATALERLTRRPADFYGFVENLQFAPHLQTWFLLFEPQVVRHPAFEVILAQPFSTMNKPAIIAKGEIGLSRRLVESGFRYEAAYLTDREGLAARRHPANAMHLLWRELIFEGAVPFVKIELLRDNPLNLESAETILRTLEPLDPAFCDIIRSHLARISTRPPSPPPQSIDSLGTQFARWANGRRHEMLRQGYHLGHSNRRATELWNLAKLEIFTQALDLARALNGARRAVWNHPYQ